MNNDRSTISNQYHEIKQAADKLKVPSWVIHWAKSKVGDSRKAIVNYVMDKKAIWEGIV